MNAFCLYFFKTVETPRFNTQFQFLAVYATDYKIKSMQMSEKQIKRKTFDLQEQMY